jgi:hypothetical protein
MPNNSFFIIDNVSRVFSANINRFRKRMQPRTRAKLNKEILVFAHMEVDKNFRTETSGPSGIRLPGLSTNYQKWKSMAIRKGYNIKGHGTVIGPNKIMQLTGKLRNLPPADNNNEAWFSQSNADGLILEARAQRGLFPYAAYQIDVQRRNIMPNKQNVLKFAKKVYERQIRRSFPRG